MANPRILIVGIIFLTNSTVTADPLPRTDALGDPLPDFALARSGSVRWRHGGLIDALAVSTDGTLIASHGVGDAVRVWDAKTGKPVRQFPAGPWGSHALAFSPDGKQLALAVQVVADVEKVGGRKPVGTFFRWDLRTGQEMERSDGFPGISTGGRNRNALVWAADGPQVAETQGASIIQYDPQVHGGPGRALVSPILEAVAGLAFEPDGKRLYSIHDGGLIHVQTVGRPDVRWRMRDSKIAGDAFMAVSPDGKSLAVRLPDAVAIVDTETGKVRHRWDGEIARTMAMAFSADNQSLVTAAVFPQGRLRFWNLETGKEKWAEDLSIYSWNGIALTPSARHFVGTDSGGRLRIGDVATGREIARWDAATARCPALSPDGKKLAFVFCGTRIAVREWTEFVAGRFDAGSPIDVGTEISALTFAPDGKRLAAACADGTVQIRDAADGKTNLQLRTAGNVARAVLFSPDGRLIVTIAEGELPSANPRRKVARPAVQMWGAASGTPLAIGEELERWAHSVAFHPNGRAIAGLHISAAARTAMDPFTDYKFGVRHSIEERAESVRLWDLDAQPNSIAFDNSIQKERLANSGGLGAWSPPRPVMFSPDGDTFAVAVENEVIIYETASGLPRFRLNGHLNAVTGVSFAADGRTLVSCGADGLVLTWDVTGLRAPGRLPGTAANWWQALADLDSVKAGRALWCLADAPEQSLPLLRERMQPIVETKFSDWIAALGNAKFAEREAAFHELEWAGVAAAPALRKALADGSAPEIRRRIEQLLARLPNGKPSLAELQALRGVEVLRRIGTPEARQILAEAARGADAAYLTRGARAALR